MNSFGHLFKVSSFGESHGSHVGCVIDGCPAGLLLDKAKIQEQVDRRKTNQSSFATTRNEEDTIEIISGVFENTTTGSPITILIRNKDAHSADYDELREVFRPNHADFTYQSKYGIRDHRGGGRSSVRISAPLVAAGAIATQLMRTESAVKTTAYVSRIGNISILDRHNYLHFDLTTIDSNEVRCPDKEVSSKMIQHIEEVKAEGDTLGGIITCVIQQVPVGLGEPIFSKLQAELSAAMLAINSVKGFEYGYGFDSTSMKGSEYNDLFENSEKGITTTTNFSGGIQGGISNGMDIYFHVAFKPISGIQKKQQTVNRDGETVTIEIGGRHDVCAVPRAVPIVEAYTNIVLANAFLHSKLSKI